MRRRILAYNSAHPMADRAFRVLVVDDDAIREFVDRVLTRAGYDTVLAADGPQAIEIAETQGPFDLLLADVMVPVIAGQEVARRVTATRCSPIGASSGTRTRFLRNR
jgi:CheY-like chemotaxis protein